MSWSGTKKQRLWKDICDGSYAYVLEDTAEIYVVERSGMFEGKARSYECPFLDGERNPRFRRGQFN